MNFGLLVSGNLGYEMLQKISQTKQISYVFTDYLSDRIIQHCEIKNIPYFKGNPRNGKSNNFLTDKKCDYILSINYLFIIDREIINHPNNFAINFHGSLLPKYRGRTPHVWAIINNENRTGITAHIIDENCDTGDIIEQIEIVIDENDTGIKILEKFNRLYWDLITHVIYKLENHNLALKKQDESKATYFSKRTADDGHINWNWQKERIRNWVRAQAYPYPGAFTFLENTKITIDEIKFVDDGFQDTMPNGFVLSTNPVKIKTPNGVVELTEIRENSSIININSVLS